MKYRNIKLAVNEVFFEDHAGFNMCDKLYPAERWTWIALRAACAANKFCPFVCFTPNKGFPDELLAKMLRTQSWTWIATKRKLIAYGKIAVDPKTNVIRVNNMDRWLIHRRTKEAK